jgi:hypothetical protein
MVVVLAMVVATARGTKHCPTVAEATVHVLATMLAAAEVPAMSSKTEGPATRRKSESPTAMEAVLSCHKTSKSQ